MKSTNNQGHCIGQSATERCLHFMTERKRAGQRAGCEKERRRVVNKPTGTDRDRKTPCEIGRGTRSREWSLEHMERKEITRRR
jgi:hypothetical protein